MRILVTGSRDWPDDGVVEDAIVDYLAKRSDTLIDFTLVEGGCPTGADRWAREFARAYGAEIETHPADWETHGKRAGYLRNQEMVDAGADVVLAFIKDESRGATMTAGLARGAGLDVREFTI